MMAPERERDLPEQAGDLTDQGERMYRLICDTSENAFLYYSFQSRTYVTLGRWRRFFPFDICREEDWVKLEMTVDEPYVEPLRHVLFPEREGKKNARVECMLRSKKIWLEFSATVFCDEKGEPVDKVIRVTDRTRYRQQDEELTYMAFYDSLTGLYNRNYFVRLLGEFVRNAKEHQERISILVVDIDDFHKVNDGLGIIVGDELVQQFGAVLKEFASEKVIVCHLNSDVYCMAIYEPYGEETEEVIYQKIKERIRHPFTLSGGQELTITVSVGVAQYPHAASSALELINCAEIVMMKSKSSGKNAIQYFDAPMLREFLQNVQIENKLKEAVFHQNFSLHYQPQFYTVSKRLRGMEALIRWQDRDHHMISPALFIPIAEKNGSIIPIGNWVMEQSIKQYHIWKEKYALPIILSINISAIQYMKEEFVEVLLGLLEKYRVNPSEIELEITESVLIEDFEKVAEKLRILRGHGIRVSLDDFGTGFSSLSYLKRLPIDTLKIDKSFIDTVLTDAATRVITETIINMARTLGFETVAEGVEQEQQYKYLYAVGCNVIQGYYLGRPQTAQQIEELLKRA